MAQKICYICHKAIKDDSQSLKNHEGYCHINCFNKYINKLSNKKRREQNETKAPRTRKVNEESTAPVTKRNKTEEEYRVQKDFADYLLKISGETKPRVEWLALAKNYSETYKFSYSDMKLALMYWFEIQGNQYVKDKNPVGMIPYIINDALTFYSNLAETKEKNKDFDFKKLNDRKEIHIEKPKGKPIKLVNIGSIG